MNCWPSRKLQRLLHRAVLIISAWSISGGGGCSCMLLLHPIPTGVDAGPNATFAPCVLTFAPYII